MTEVRTATRFNASARLTPANALTLARILLAPVLFALIFAAEETGGASWPVFSLGVVLALTDHYDGQLARRHGTTRSGAFLDPLADKVVVIGAMVCLVMVERYWWLPVALVTARELAITAMRAHYARSGMAIPARTSAKYKTLVQGLALLVAVIPVLRDTRTPAVVALWIAVAMTLWSGWQYVRDGSNGTTTSGSLH
jgi:CDP-diacylglycerol---glycerol-3-phosphate 3-phosphatidyltransferase